MRILMVLDHEFPPDIRVENEMETLIAAGVEVHLACYTRKNRIQTDSHLGAVIHRKPITKLAYKSSVACLKFPFYFNFWRSFIGRICSQYAFDAIHIHDLPLARVGLEMAAKYQLRCHLDLHENWPALLRMAPHTQSLLGKMLSSNSQWESYEVACCTKADHIIVVVDESKDRLSQLGIEADKISVVSNTLNFNHFTYPETTPDDTYITLLYAGGITEHRGLQYVIEGLKHLKHLSKPIRFLILGTGSYVDELKKITRQHHLTEQVHFEGWKNFKDMQSYFGRANFCLIPHIKSDHTDSTIPHKLFQHMVAGKPTIASNCAPIERILKNTDSGLVYEFNKPEQFARCVEQLINDSALKERLTQNGIKAVQEKYHWGVDSKNLLKIYS